MPSPDPAVSSVASGRAWVFGDDISTDLLQPGIYAAEPPEERKTHTLESVNPRFAAEVAPGDIVVAGTNFGCGSSRETAPEALKALGVRCVVADGMARIFLRNAVAIGLPVLVCPGVSAGVIDGDEVEVDLNTGTVLNRRTGALLWGQSLPPMMRDVLDAGGVIPLLRRLAAASPPAGGWIG